jgi:hypothetical protein
MKRRLVRARNGQVYEMPWAPTADSAYKRRHALGEAPNPSPMVMAPTYAPMQSPMANSHPADQGGYQPDSFWAQFEEVPAFYTVSVFLDEDSGSVGVGSVPLRPEPFVCRRITWATTGDVPPRYTGPATSSAQGRAVTVQWDDEFTRFLGSRPSLLSALFGDSQGFLDIPRGVLLQGKQTLSVTLNRLFYPAFGEGDPGQNQFDIVFHGIGLLPKGVHQSGSAG